VPAGWQEFIIQAILTSCLNNREVLDLNWGIFLKMEYWEVKKNRNLAINK
jgi:hypothetical protein